MYLTRLIKRLFTSTRPSDSTPQPSLAYAKRPLHLDDHIESLYNLDRAELRRLAAECLLISDGPDSELAFDNPGTSVTVLLKASEPVVFHMTIWS